MKLSDRYNRLHAKLGVIRRSLTSDAKVGIQKSIWCWKHGFEADKALIYDFDKYNVDDYLSEVSYSMTRFLNGDYCELFNNKILFEEIASKYIKVPTNYALIEKGAVLCMHGLTESELMKIIQNNGCVIKPIFGCQGDGVYIVNVHDGKIYIDNKKSDFNKLSTLIKKLDGFIIMEFIRQGKYASELYQLSTNTIRIVVMRDPIDHKAFIGGAVQRIGTVKTGSIDNFSKGGLAAGIDMETGLLDMAIGKVGNSQTRVSCHPDTGAPIKGVKIPEWQSACKEITDFFDKIPYIKYVGLDVVLTDKGVVIIEGNSHCQVGALQCYKPLLLNPKTRRFYEYYHII